MERFTGSCLCGDVKIVALGQPYRVGLCHCMDCRKTHGALFHASAIFPQDAVTIDGKRATMPAGISAPVVGRRCSAAPTTRSR